MCPTSRRRAQLVDLGLFAPVAEAARRARADIDLLASRRLPFPVRDSVLASVSAALTVIDRAVRAAVAATSGDGRLVIVPTGSLWLLPWGAVPSLRGRPVTVTPSASRWISAEHSASVAEGRTVIVGGPDLRHAAPEVAEVAACYGDPVTLAGATATVPRVLDAMSGAATVHVAAHGEHDPDNALFSRIWLQDGPLMAYDLQTLPQAPGHVVLASCDSGRNAVHPGDDVLGLPAAFLHAGTRTVVASVARIGDESARLVMTGYHRALATCGSPAEALAEATREDPLSAYVCFGTA